MFFGIVARLRSLWAGVRRRSLVEADLDEQFRLHVELRARDLERTGLSANAALRNARREFGSPERYKEEARAARGLRRIDEFRFSWLDFKLGLRMLVKYPGLTIVGGLALAFAIFIGAGTFEFVRQVVHPVLPLPEGDRIVGIRLWHRAANGVEEQASFDFLRWSEQVRSVEDLSAYRTLQRNLITDSDLSYPVRTAQISASAFRVVRVTPLHGRPLVEADELPGAPAVAVIGHDIWRTTFAGDARIVGRTVRLGDVEHTVVGVMPEGFAFPVSHSVWTPLKPSELRYGPRQGPWVYVFGRLAPGVTRAQAQTEFTTLGVRAAADFPRTHEHLQPQVIPYAKTILRLPTAALLALGSTNVFALMLLFLICANVALLMFARAATRESEIVVRNALGASRARIITQLFTEALVLGLLAALVGISLTRVGVRWVLDAVRAEVMDGRPLPFWFSNNLSLTTVLYAALLAVLCALSAGILPALKVTRAPGSRLRQVGAGSGGLQFGGVWTVVIAAQVAVTVASPVFSFFVRRDAEQIRSVEVGFPDDEYLSVRMQLDRENPADVEAARAGTGGLVTDSSQLGVLARFRKAHQELERRLAAEGAVAGVTFGERLPRMYHDRRYIELDEGGAQPMDPRWPGYPVSSASVGLNYFDVLAAPILMGRGFHTGDLTRDARVVIVNQSFVRLVLGGRNPIGRRLRRLQVDEMGTTAATAAPPGPWYEIIGVVRDMGMSHVPDPKVAGFYEPAAAGSVYPVQLAVHVRGDPLSFAPRLRAIAAAVDPALRLENPTPVSQLNRSELVFIAFWFKLTVLVSAVALLLSLAGIYSVTSFAVSRRTREIGIRVALGANPRRVIAATFKRPLAQVGTGIVAGGALAATLSFLILGGAIWPLGAIAVAGYAALMMAVCSLACIVPTRRALRIQPTDALKQE